MKPGDIIFFNKKATHFCILIVEISLKDVSYRTFKTFYSNEGIFYIDTIMLSSLKYVSEGIWEYWD